jgi:type IV pilus assembly protein PilV
LNPAKINMQKHKQTGVSLIEVLVAILIVALGILSMAIMQTNVTRLSKTSEVRTMGNLLASDLADRMRANPSGVAAGAYAFGTVMPTTAPDFSVDTACNSTTSNCTPSQLASFDLADWRENVYKTLPSGWARIGPYDTVNHAHDLWLIWQEPDERAAALSPVLDPCPSGVAPSTANGVSKTIRCMYFRINL